MKALVSILIPVYNRETIIAETLEAALSQTYENIEVIVVDNASTDNTWHVIQMFSEKDSRIKAFKNESNVGPVRNWLRCVEEASGYFGKILWSDDLISPEFIAQTLPLFDENIGFVYTGANIFTGTSLLDTKTSYLLNGTGVYDTSIYIEKAILGKGVPVSPGCAIFRMSDIRKNLWLDVPNKINSDFSMHAIGNDLLLFLLTANSYKSFGHISEPLSFFRAHKDSISVSSENGKLHLHYALVRAYFAENYAPSLIDCLKIKLHFMLFRFDSAKGFGINSVDDFFVRDEKINKWNLVKRMFLGKFFI